MFKSVVDYNEHVVVPLVSEGRNRLCFEDSADKLLKDLLESSRVQTGGVCPFTEMLGLISEQLTTGISYTQLHGNSTLTQMQEAVEKFQQNKDTRVFLLSPKAGSTGLNLTAANYVYPRTPWWNAAAGA